MIANDLFRTRFEAANKSPCSFDVRLAAEFVKKESIVFVDGALFFRDQARGLQRSNYPDLSGYESIANKMFVCDFVKGSPGELFLVGVAACEMLCERLTQYEFPFKVVFSDSGQGCPVIRFYLEREGEVIHGHPDGFRSDAIAIWSWRPESDGKRDRNA